MSIEAGARAATPHDTTLRLRRGTTSPHGPESECALDDWRSPPTDYDATFDMECDGSTPPNSVRTTAGHQPGDSVTLIDEAVPRPRRWRRPSARWRTRRSRPAPLLREIRPTLLLVRARTRVSRTCRLPRRRWAEGSPPDARWSCRLVGGEGTGGTRGPRPGVLRRRGSSGARAGCPRGLGMNLWISCPGERSASTSNRNFEGRQGKGGRTHLVSRGCRGHHRLRRAPRTELIRVIEEPRCRSTASDVLRTRSSRPNTSKRIERTGVRAFCSPSGARAPTS